MSETHEIVGYCPMGCGKTLFLGKGGHVTCGYLKCPNPSAVTDLLTTSESEHVVEFKDGLWTLQHPLKDRVEGHLFTCPATLACEALDGPPVQDGRYRMIPRVRGDGDPAWTFLKAG